ncbi:hypothetical protein BLOT_013679 [Blomia tropicalis]|nr:hypothetical protein BLOT_013679 [Blomia tropicalis]
MESKRTHPISFLCLAFVACSIFLGSSLAPVAASSKKVSFAAIVPISTIHCSGFDTFEMCQKVVIHDDDDDEEEKSYHLSIDPCDGYIVENWQPSRHTAFRAFSLNSVNFPFCNVFLSPRFTLLILTSIPVQYIPRHVNRSVDSFGCVGFPITHHIKNQQKMKSKMVEGVFQMFVLYGHSSPPHPSNNNPSQLNSCKD